MSEKGTRKAALRGSNDYKETKRFLEPLIVKVLYFVPRMDEMMLPSRSFLFEENLVEFNAKWKEAERISRILKDLKSVTYPSQELESMSKMLGYLGMVESLGVTLVDMLLLILIANEYEVHTRGPYSIHVTSFEELADIDLGFKLKFLKDNGINIAEKIVDRELRNIIAHLKFRILENGDIRDRGNNRVLVDEKISRFWRAVDTLKLVFEDCLLLKRLAELTKKDTDAVKKE